MPFSAEMLVILRKLPRMEAVTIGSRPVLTVSDLFAPLVKSSRPFARLLCRGKGLCCIRAAEVDASQRLHRAVAGGSEEAQYLEIEHSDTCRIPRIQCAAV